MTVKRFTLIVALLALLTAGVSAHDTPGYRESRLKLGFYFSLGDEIILEATGLGAEELRDSLAAGSSIAALIAANDGDVTAVIAAAVAQLTDVINQRAASTLEALDEQVGEALHKSHTRRGLWARHWYRLPRLFAYAGAGDAITAATGLEAVDLRTALADGSTLAELIEANGGDAASVADDLVTAISDEITAAAAERVESLEESITEAFNSDLAESLRRRRRGRQGPTRFGFFFGNWSRTGTPAAETPVG